MRNKKTEHPKVAALQERAKAVENVAVRQTVPLDFQTFDKIVQFVEEEGCTLSEGLRRAVRIGVEALMLERSSEHFKAETRSEACPIGESVSIIRPVKFVTNNLEEDEYVEDENGEGVDYSAVPPPGI